MTQNALLGYAWLIDYFSLQDIEIAFACQSATIASIKTHEKCGQSTRLFPMSYRPHVDTPIHHLQFAFKYEYLNLTCLNRVFQQAEIPSSIEQALLANPSSKYFRLAGFYYEWLTHKALNVPHLTSGNYVDAIDSAQYYVAETQRDRKFRVNNNLTGDGRLSAILRRNTALIDDEALNQLSKASFAMTDANLLARTTRYLIALETRSSSEIEAEPISPSKQMKFMQALETISHDELTKEKLIDTLNIIKDTKYQEFDYRCRQNYLGKGGRGYASVDYVTPKPEDAHLLMDSWFSLRNRVMASDMPAIAKAAVLSSSFVYIHPFMDGNGRLSRYIMQDTLYKTGAIDHAYALPLSAGILKNIEAYYAVLKSLSRHIMKGVKFTLLDNYEVVVDNETADLYRHLAFDPHAQFLSDMARQVAEIIIPAEIERLRRFDILTARLDSAFDLPEKDITLMANLLIENHGAISQKKRKGVLQHIHSDDLDAAERIFQAVE
jgi:hypothetical protein